MTDHQPIAIDEVAAAAITGISVSSLQKMRVRGDGPSYLKIGSRVRYRVSDLEQFLANHVLTSTSAQAA